MTHQFGIGGYRTRDGRVAEVHMVDDGVLPHRLLGRIGNDLMTWTLMGIRFGLSQYKPGTDLIAPIDEPLDGMLQAAGELAQSPVWREAICRAKEQLVSEQHEKPAGWNLLAGPIPQLTGWTDITAALPGHHQVVTVQDEEGNISVARMEAEHGLQVVWVKDACDWYEFGTVKRWRVA